MAQKYPKCTLQDVLPMAEAVYRQNKECKVSTLATAVNASIKASGFKTRKAAAKWYGLINEEGDTVKLTEIAVSIFAPLSGEEKAASLIKAFKSFAIFSDLYEHLPVGVKLTKDRIATLAERECEIDVDNKETFVNVFLNSAVLVKLLKETEDGFYEKPCMLSDTIATEECSDDIGEKQDKPSSNLQFNTQDIFNTPLENRNAAKIPSFAVNININIDSNTNIQVLEELFNRIEKLKDN